MEGSDEESDAAESEEEVSEEGSSDGESASEGRGSESPTSDAPAESRSESERSPTGGKGAGGEGVEVAALGLARGLAFRAASQSSEGGEEPRGNDDFLSRLTKAESAPPTPRELTPR